METSEILSILANFPRSIPSEIGTTPAEMAALEKEGLVVNVGTRKTGKRGRPPIEWAINDGSVEGADTSPVKGAPKLPDISDIRPILDAEEINQVEYIEAVFAGERGQRELGDYRLLAERYEQIANTRRRSSGRLRAAV